MRAPLDAIFNGRDLLHADLLHADLLLFRCKHYLLLYGFIQSLTEKDFFKVLQELGYLTPFTYPSIYMDIKRHMLCRKVKFEIYLDDDELLGTILKHMKAIKGGER
jgi:hypothetical protein